MIVSSHPKIGYSALLVICFALLFALQFLTVGSHSEEIQENVRRVPTPSTVAAFADTDMFFSKELTGWSGMGYRQRGTADPSCSARSTSPEGSELILAKDLKDGEFFLKINNSNWQLRPKSQGYVRLDLFRSSTGMDFILADKLVYEAFSEREILIPNVDSKIIDAFSSTARIDFTMPTGMRTLTMVLASPTIAMKMLADCVADAKHIELYSTNTPSGVLSSQKDTRPKTDAISDRLISKEKDDKKTLSDAMVGICKISNGDQYLCSNQSANSYFVNKFDGYWFGRDKTVPSYGSKRKVISFSKNAIATCLGKLKESPDGDGSLLIGPPMIDGDQESICLITKADARAVTTICKLGERCIVNGFTGEECQGECANISLVIDVKADLTPDTQVKPADLTPVQCFGNLRTEKSPYFSLTLLQRDGGVACVVDDKNADSLIAKECQVGRFCVITAATATNCRSESPTPEAIKAGFVPLSGCKMLSGVTAARGEIKTVKPITKDSTLVLADTASPNATDSKAGTPSFAETANFILTTNKSWSSVNFDGVWSTKITNYNQAKCSVDIETHFGVFLIAQGTLNLNGLKSWKGTPMTVYDGSRNQFRYRYAAFTIEKDGSVFKGKFKQANFKDAASMLISQTFDSCSDRCSFAVPSDSDWARTKKAVNYLFENFCAQGKPDPF